MSLSVIMLICKAASQSLGSSDHSLPRNCSETLFKTVHALNLINPTTDV